MRLARICIASIRYFYPDVPVRILAGGPLPASFIEELAAFWNVELADLPTGDYGWGFVKLEPLFGPAGERFLVCDADTVFTGPVLDLRTNDSAPFLVDAESLPESELRRLYYDWNKLEALVPGVQAPIGAFNSGQWFGTAGILSRRDFDPWLEWTMPRHQRHPDFFMGGDQGILNFVLLASEASGTIRVDRGPLMRWPGHGMDDLEPDAVISGRAPARVVHWAGMKAVFHRNMVAHDLLGFFEGVYYSRIPGSAFRRLRDHAHHVVTHGWFHTSRPFRLRWNRWFGDSASQDGRWLPTATQIVERLPRFLRRHKLMTAWMRLTAEPTLQPVRIRDDCFGYADMADGFLRLIVIDGDYNADFFEVADPILASGGTFLDVGANFGLLSFGLAGRHGSAIDFHLFEPNSDLVTVIERSRALYPDMRCTIVTAAVSDCPGSVGFTVVEDQTGISHIAPDGDHVVPSVTLDDYLDDAGLDHVALVKLDIEGYELLALRGAEQSLRKRTIGALYFEYSEKWLVRVGPPADLIAFLDSVGYATCFCRTCDHRDRGEPTHTIAHGLPGHGLRLLPVSGHTLPPATDLLAVPVEHLEPMTAGAC